MKQLEDYLNSNISLQDTPLEQISENLEMIVEHIKSAKENKKRDILFILQNIKPTPSYEDDKTDINFIKLIIQGQITYNQLPEHLKNTEYNYISGIYDPYQVLHDKELLKSKLWIATVIERFPEFYKHIPKKYKNDISYTYELLKRNGFVFQYLDEEKRNDKFYCNAALASRSWSIDINLWNTLPPKFTSDPEFVLKYVLQDHRFFKKLPDDLKNNPEIYEKVLLTQPQNLEFLNNTLRNDINFVEKLKPLKNFKLAAVGKKLLNNPNFLFSHLEKNPDDIFICGNKIKNDENIAKLVFSKPRGSFYLNCEPYIAFFDNTILNNKELVFMALCSDKRTVNYISDEIKKDKDFYLNYISSKEYENSLSFEFNPELLKDIDIIIALLKKSPNTINKLDENLKHDPISFKKLIKNCPDASKKYLLTLFDFKEGEEKPLFSYLNNSYFLNTQKFTDPSAYNDMLRLQINNPYYQEIMSHSHLYNYLDSFLLKDKLSANLTDASITKKKLKI